MPQPQADYICEKAANCSALFVRDVTARTGADDGTQPEGW